jgi:hypothetical protein
VGLSYADAVLLMGGRESRTVTALDRLSGGALLAASAAGGGFALSLFEAKGEMARLSGELVRELGQRVRGLDRYTRGERLAAAHSVVALAAYFEVLARADLPFAAAELELTKSEQVALAGGGPPGSKRLRSLATGLLRAEVPMPVPQRSRAATLDAMRVFYRNLSVEVSRFVSGLSIWDRLSEPNRSRFTEILSGDLPDQAVTRYEERFRQLAAQFPEVAFWAAQTDHQATQEGIRHLGIGMAGLERLLTDIAAGQVPDERRLGLSRAYRAALRRPVLATADTPPGLRFPLLGDAYVNPDFRAVEATGLSDRFTDESWWHRQPVRQDLEEFLFGYVISPQAVEAPLLVLGQPGSGKSVLTQMLAAQLPPDNFAVVRVALREVAADADLQAQIEDAIRLATGETMSWPALVRSAAGTLPVVLLDGFDELLQATGVSQTDYLRRIAEFQRREAELGRPVAILVTSRTAVADRAKPAPGMVVVRLEPFREAQISRWLEVWNHANAEELASRGLRPLASRAALEHADLASQPLLLLMLALYDADGNRLQRDAASMREAELYERLLVSFAEREVRKSGADLSSGQFQEAVERELLRLSVVAIGMFSRSRQWISDAELDRDLLALLDMPGVQVAPPGLRAPLSAGQVMVGRFFFIHEARATRDDMRLHTYEFLHATFGEYLIARLVTRELEDIADAAEFAAARARPYSADDAFLHALLSHMPITMRGTIVAFAAERLQDLPESRRRQISAVLLELFQGSFRPRQADSYHNYAPAPTSVPAQYAAYSANLVTLAVLAAGQVTGRSLFLATADPVAEWRKLALLWRSQLPPDGWAGLVYTLSLERVWRDDNQRDILVHYGKERAQSIDLYWSYRRHLADSRSGPPFGWRYNLDEWLRDQAWFLCHSDDDTLAHALESFAGNFDDGAISSFHSHWQEQGRTVSTANALITLWLLSASDCSPTELTDAYDTCLEIAIRGKFSPTLDEIRHRFRTLVLRQLAADQQHLPLDWLNSVILRLREVTVNRSSEAEEREELRQIAGAMLPGLMDADT